LKQQLDEKARKNCHGEKRGRRASEAAIYREGRKNSLRGEVVPQKRGTNLSQFDPNKTGTKKNSGSSRTGGGGSHTTTGGGEIYTTEC